MVPDPNKDLLLRQRTFSIDETRELLRQGKPVHREAIVEGAVDYHSLMFGEGTEEDNRGVVEAEIAVQEKKNGSWAALVMSNAKAPEPKPQTTKSTSKKREEKKAEAKVEVKNDVKAEIKTENKETTSRSKELPKERKSEGNGEEHFKEVKDKKPDHRRSRESNNSGHKVS